MAISSGERRQSFSIENIESGDRPTMTPTGWKHVARRSDRGLSVDGTRLSLYTIMDHLKDEWPPQLIQDTYDLTDEQIEDVIDYIEVNRDEFEAEYNAVLKVAAERERDWRERNRERIEQSAKRSSEKMAALRAEIQARKEARRKSFSIEDIDTGHRPTITPTAWKHVFRRSDRGLTVDGSRLTLYAIMDYLKEEWPRYLVRDWFRLTDEQIDDVIDYITVNCEEVEKEYQEVLEAAAERERYWRERNAQSAKRVTHLSPPPGMEEAWAKLQERKKQWQTA